MYNTGGIERREQKRERRRRDESNGQYETDKCIDVIGCTMVIACGDTNKRLRHIPSLN
jgi:hypothetical protein